MNKVGMMLASLFVVVGCGGGGISLGSLGDEMEDSVCAAQVECGAFADMQSCRDSTFFDMGQILASEEDGRVEYDSDQASECIDLFASASGCDLFGAVDEDDLEEACDGVFTGTVELGAECYDNEECVGEAYCDMSCGDLECCAGTCVADDTEPDADPVAIGQDCSEADCVDGAYCGDDPEICVAAGGEGVACPGFGAEYCTAGLYCDAFFEASTCYRPGAEGGECDPSRGFGVFACERTDLFCDGTDNICKTRLEAGATCDSEIDNCAFYAYCDGSVCVASPGVGNACGGQEEIDCLGDLECESSICVAPDADAVCGPDSPS